MLCRVAGTLAQIKVKVREQVADLDSYVEIRDLLGDCQELMAVHCDTAPIRLIAGRVDEIMGNLASSEKPVLQGE